MKYFVVALFSTLVACGVGASNETVGAAESALVSLNKARVMLASIASVEDAKNSEEEFSKIGLNYSESLKLMSLSNGGDQEVALELAKITPKIAAEYQGMLLELNALQSRNSKAAQILLDELKAFKSKR